MNAPKNDEYYVEKIMVDLRFIVRYMDGVTVTELTENELLLDSMAFRLIQVQENAKNLTKEFKEAHKNVPWGDIAGLRNHIVHDYGNVDLSILFITLTEDVPYLLRELERTEL